jgi:Ca-activated chloride channel homolog
MHRGVVALLAVLLSGLVSAPEGLAQTAAAPQPKPRVMIVLDGSGSMLAPLDGKTRIAVAREALAELLKDWDQQSELGLVAYGHRRKGDCADIEVAVPPGKPDVQRMLAIANALRPQGMTPLSAAVRRAAEALKFTEQRATVILVSDGQENCSADPCAVGRELKAKGVDFRAFVIGFAVTRAEESGLRCLAETTGGRYFPARDAKGLRRALEEAGRAALKPEAPKPPPRADTAPPEADLPATVAAPARVPAGKNFDVRWTGGNREGDQIAIVRGEGDQAPTADSAYTRDGNPTTLTAPERGGRYEVRYVAARGGVLARQRVDVEQATATVSGPANGTAGGTVPVTWTGPNQPDDFVTIVKPDSEDRAYITYAYTRDGSPVQLRLPEEPGAYELRYVTGREYIVLARVPIAVTAAMATLSAPDDAVAGSTVEIAFTGPANPNDYITIVKPSDKDDVYTAYHYAESGSPARLVLSSTAGEYEIRYVTGRSSRVLARRKIVARGVAIAVDAPASAPIGTEIEIRWTGPNNEKDYVTIVKTGAPDSAYTEYKYTRDGNPIRLRVSHEPGDYEIRYNNDQDGKVLARRALVVVAATAALTAPDRARAGSKIEIGWRGPNGPTDYITIVKEGAAEGDYKGYFYVRDGGPDSRPQPLEMPAEPGRYELRYVIEAGPKTIGRRPIIVE